MDTVARFIVNGKRSNNFGRAIVSSFIKLLFFPDQNKRVVGIIFIRTYQQFVLFKIDIIMFVPTKTHPMVTIYALLENNQIRFIGKTTKLNLLEKLNQHLDEAITDPDKFGWINQLLAKGQTPEIKPVLTFNDDEAPQYEKLFLNHFKFFIGLKLNAIEVSSPQKVLQAIHAQKLDALRAAI